MGIGCQTFCVGEGNGLTGRHALDATYHGAVALHYAGIDSRQCRTSHTLRRCLEAQVGAQCSLVAGRQHEVRGRGGSGGSSHGHADVVHVERAHIGFAAALDGEVVGTILGRDEVAAQVVHAGLVGDVRRGHELGVQGVDVGRNSHVGSHALHERSVACREVEVVEVAGFQLQAGQYHIVVTRVLCIVLVVDIAVAEGPGRAVVVGIDHCVV